VEHPPHKGALEHSGGGKQQAHREKELIRGPGGKEGEKPLLPEDAEWPGPKHKVAFLIGVLSGAKRRTYSNRGVAEQSEHAP